MMTAGAPGAPTEQYEHVYVYVWIGDMDRLRRMRYHNEVRYITSPQRVVAQRTVAANSFTCGPGGRLRVWGRQIPSDVEPRDVWDIRTVSHVGPADAFMCGTGGLLRMSDRRSPARVGPASCHRHVYSSTTPYTHHRTAFPEGAASNVRYPG